MSISDLWAVLLFISQLLVFVTIFYTLCGCRWAWIFLSWAIQFWDRVLKRTLSSTRAALVGSQVYGICSPAPGFRGVCCSTQLVHGSWELIWVLLPEQQAPHRLIYLPSTEHVILPRVWNRPGLDEARNILADFFSCKVSTKIILNIQSSI